MKRQAVILTTIGVLLLIAIVSCGLEKILNTEDSPAIKLYENKNTMMLQNSKFAYVRTLKTGHISSSQIFICNFDGNDEHQLTNSPGVNFHPSWSPDGTKIVFVSLWENNPVNKREIVGPNSDIYIMNEDGSNQIRLTFEPGEDSWPCWSPDGTKIAFQSTRNRNSYIEYQIYTINPDGSDLQLITPDGGAYPSWSPDGSRIMYAWYDGIEIINANGKNRYLLGTDEYDVCPAWSPDGSKIVYKSMRGGHKDSPSVWWVMDINSKEQKQITDDVLPYTPNHPLGTLNWSPDGQKLVYTSFIVISGDLYRTVQVGIHVMDPDGSNNIQLIPNIGGDRIAWWAPR